MQVTKTTIKKAIKDLGLDLANFKLYKNEIETAREDIELGNKEVSKVVKHISSKDNEYHGFMTGYGSWIYRFEWYSPSRELAFNNID